VAKLRTITTKPTRQKSQPMGLRGRREAIRAPTVGYASISSAGKNPRFGNHQ
jgi:hypothetical protein